MGNREQEANAFTVAETLGEALKASIGKEVLPFYAKPDDEMLIVIDSSGAASQFAVGILITTMSMAVEWWNHSFMPWDRARKYPGQRLSYKEVRAASEQNVLELNAFTRIADRLPGLLVGISSPPITRRVLTGDHDVRSHPDLGQFRQWNPNLFERLFRTGVGIAAAMSPIVSHPHRWTMLHDTDEMFEGTRRDVAKDYLRTLISALRGEVTPVAIVTKDETKNGPLSRALLGIPDYAAAATGSSLKAYFEAYGPLPDEPVKLPEGVAVKDEELVCWFGMNQGRLLKMMMSYGEIPGKVLVHPIELKGKQSRADTE